MRLFLAAFVFLLLSAVPAAAQEPQDVRVGVYVLNVGKFDVSTGSYTVDFYLSFRCDRPCDPGAFEFANGRATSVDQLIDEPAEKFYRIQAALSQNIDLRNYPFDRHNLTIELEDKQQTVEQLRYAADADYSAVDPAVIIVGWELSGWNASVDEHRYEPYDETYSRLRPIFLPISE